ncbi:hypothetical protein M407DRAFT_245397 [Tulasnella calospora MUT 4182]|uniref:Uncharacterized protein n=1 Tax=Tulasnella calospora MUT 4182 TaxID=1051891 RepID=A0A0C3KJS5_9AGAM|nr:hypothetical protein M407DRAFT_245397 [Tulasnella calospora MUT 4182]
MGRSVQISRFETNEFRYIEICVDYGLLCSSTTDHAIIVCKVHVIGLTASVEARINTQDRLPGVVDQD